MALGGGCQSGTLAVIPDQQRELGTITDCHLLVKKNVLLVKVTS